MNDLLISEIADAYYASIPNKDVRQPKRVVLFSGVPGSGKSTVAKAIQAQLKATHLSNDEVRDCIVAAEPGVGEVERERAKFDIGMEILERLGAETHGLVVVDASCDRGFDVYRDWASRHGFRIVLFRMDIPKDVIRQRLSERGNQGYRDVRRAVSMLDTWWSQWETFGASHQPDMTITMETQIDAIINEVIRTADHHSFSDSSLKNRSE